MPEIKNYIIGIIIFTFFIVGGVSFMGILKNSDASFGSDPKYSEFNKTFNKFNQVTTNINNISDSIQNSENQDFGILGVLNSLISTAWNTLRLTFTSFGFMNSVLLGTSLFGIPSWIPAMIILIITIIIAFQIYSAIFAKDI